MTDKNFTVDNGDGSKGVKVEIISDDQAKTLGYDLLTEDQISKTLGLPAGLIMGFHPCDEISSPLTDFRNDFMKSIELIKLYRDNPKEVLLKSIPAERYAYWRKALDEDALSHIQLIHGNYNSLEEHAKNAEAEYDFANQFCDFLNVHLYDGGLDLLYVKKTVPLLEVLALGIWMDVFDDQDPGKELDYLLLINKLRDMKVVEWGTSARSAFIHIGTDCKLNIGPYQNELIFTTKDMTEFLITLCLYMREKCNF
jgi:hypothetical protein